ncbi:pimeloyl-ACP methyl ester carboxylesterase [Polymorphobacter multimanifer]|uniref:Pimeloyl-ACP methyl ester carboxylesterase n=1 Tax=Polymorphobacter multimanifer TaxID=1070431 RepID=A0A841L797_9SPHN|nr:alpha/beta fold hydrolase [Polymorphobacter multimanifer]MBB6226823.1 pimeloyl-ACP methyl ester carboxylesterase [Polymorphobacter multimanifer]
MRRAIWALMLAGALAGAPVMGQAVDPPRHATHPAANKQLLLPSAGVGLNALFFLAAGPEPKPTIILLHGLPGNERNLDLAQAIRRAGWNVLTFTYRGAWGSPGAFSLANSIEDTAAALAFVRTPDAVARYRIDPRRIVLAGHSMGGANAALVAAEADGLAGVALLDAANFSIRAEALAKGGEAEIAKVAAGFDDFGNALAGSSPDAVAREIAAKGKGWDLVPLAPKLARFPVLSLYAEYGIAAPNKALAAAIAAQPGARLTVAALPTSHGFEDRRLELGARLVAWLEGLVAGRGASVR